MAYRLYIFDLDGTIADAYPAITSSFNYVMKELGYPQRKPDVIRKAVGWGDTELLAFFVRKKDLARAIRIYREHHLRVLLSGVRLKPHARSLLGQLRKQGSKMAVASNRPRRFTLKILKVLKIDHYFDTVLCAGRWGRREFQPKPHPALLLELLRRFKISGKDAVYIGDMAIDVQAGRRARIATGAVPTGSSSLSQLRKSKPTYLALDLRALLRKIQVRKRP